MTTAIARAGRTSARHGAGTAQLLARLLDSPDLPAQVAALEPLVLARLIGRVGLEDAGELVAFATTEQLAHVFDEDLWKSDEPGADERFDGRRFVLWLEVMLEGGDELLARRLVELPEDLVTLAFHQQMVVLRLEDLLLEMRESDDDEAGAIEKALANCLYEEIDEYQLVSRHHDGWDAVIAAILALDRDHHDDLVRLLERCCRLSAGRIEDEGGLYAVLTESESLEEDVAGDREDRRAEAGHVAPSAAAAFLKQARQPIDTRTATRDPLTKAYFRRLAPASAAPARARGAPNDAAWVRLLESDSANDGERPRLGPHPTSADATARAAEPLLTRALRELGAIDPDAFGKRSEELAYVANVLAAGCSIAGRHLRPAEATRAALAICNLGLELSATSAFDPGSSRRAASTLQERTADVLFRAGFARLHRDVVTRARATELSGAWLRSLADDEARALASALAGLNDDCPSFDGRFVSSVADLDAIGELLTRVEEELRARR